MKTTLLSPLLILICFSGFAQNWEVSTCADLPYDFWCQDINNVNVSDTITWIEDSQLFYIDTTDSTNVWQYGHSYKTEFDSISTFEGWITDSLQTYSPNLKSHFEIVIPHHGINSPQTSWFGFEHKYDLDTLTEGCYVEYSCNNEDWNVLGIEPDGYVPIEVAYDNYPNTQWGNQTTLVHDSIPAFQGFSPNWQWSYFQLVWGLPMIDGGEEARLAQGCFYSNDSLELRIRFTFESDSIETNKSGWMIRNLIIGQNALFGAINDQSIKPFLIQPNPAAYQVRFTLPVNAEKPEQVWVLDMMGRIAWSSPYYSDNVDLTEIDPGNYLLMVRTKDETYRQRLIIQK